MGKMDQKAAQGFKNQAKKAKGKLKVMKAKDASLKKKIKQDKKTAKIAAKGVDKQLKVVATSQKKIAKQEAKEAKKQMQAKSQSKKKAKGGKSATVKLKGEITKASTKMK